VLQPDGRGADAAGEAGSPRPGGPRGRRDAPRALPLHTRVPDGAGVLPLRGVVVRAAGAREPAQQRVLAARELPRVRAERALVLAGNAVAGAPVVERTAPRALPGPPRRARAAARRARDARRRRAGRRGRPPRPPPPRRRPRPGRAGAGLRGGPARGQARRGGRAGGSRVADRRAGAGPAHARGGGAGRRRGGEADGGVSARLIPFGAPDHRPPRGAVAAGDWGVRALRAAVAPRMSEPPPSRRWRDTSPGGGVGSALRMGYETGGGTRVTPSSVTLRTF